MDNLTVKMKHLCTEYVLAKEKCKSWYINFARDLQVQKLEVVTEESRNLIARKWVEEYNCMREVEVR